SGPLVADALRLELSATSALAATPATNPPGHAGFESRAVDRLDGLCLGYCGGPSPSVHRLLHAAVYGSGGRFRAVEAGVGTPTGNQTAASQGASASGAQAPGQTRRNHPRWGGIQPARRADHP